jgi:hypothetical protein
VTRNEQVEAVLETIRESYETTYEVPGWPIDSRCLHELHYAVRWCRGYPLPAWLSNALQRVLEDIMETPLKKKRRAEMNQASRIVHAVRSAFYGDQFYPALYRHDDEKPSEHHYKAACEQLKTAGLTCTWEMVKKTWQRHKPPLYEEGMDQLLIKWDKSSI